jgi:exopolysaccharide biosynthesis protein
MDGEKGRTTTSFSSLVGAAAAVNGDFYNTNGSFDPLGLAIGEGSVWSNDTTGHRFIACTAAKVCGIDATNQARSPDPAWWSAVGGNYLLIENGAVAQSAADDLSCGSFCTTQHPRTAVGLSGDGGTLILVVVAGRQTPILGMTLNRLAQLMLELGSDVALNLDGGGSSAMVVNGSEVSVIG